MSIAQERLDIQTALTNALSQNELWANCSETDRATLVRRIERSCFNVVINECINDGIDRIFTDNKFRARYSSTCARIILNIRIDSSVGSPYLSTGLITGTINANNIGSMTSAELCPDANRACREMIEARLNQKAIQKVSRKYTCKKCQKNETTVVSYQARGSDESASESRKCINCGHVWR